ncbi:hypothetical protein HMPREF3198_01203 [Winkia neuii]|nr:hypothetical protein HMPREF3198_01203 [Winkia neuii]
MQGLKIANLSRPAMCSVIAGIGDKPPSLGFGEMARIRTPTISCGQE